MLLQAWTSSLGRSLIGRPALGRVTGLQLLVRVLLTLGDHQGDHQREEEKRKAQKQKTQQGTQEHQTSRWGYLGFFAYR